MDKGQSKKHSIYEAGVNILIGSVVALTTQLIVFPALGMDVTIKKNLTITAAFTVVSLIRSYYVRRLWDWIHVRQKLNSK